MRTMREDGESYGRECSRGAVTSIRSDYLETFLLERPPVMLASHRRRRYRERGIPERVFRPFDLNEMGRIEDGTLESVPLSRRTSPLLPPSRNVPGA